MFDLIIVGAGPAGSAAAVYAARKKLKTLMILKEWGGQSIVSEQIYNWVGTTSISGSDLAKSFKEHVKANEGENLTVKDGLLVTEIDKNGEGFVVKTDKGESFETRAVLATAGSGRRKIPAKNADRLEHKGLTYCATCDGPLFADMDVAVIGGGNAGFESAAQLLAYCKSVTLIHRNETFKADQITVDKVMKNPRMKAITNVDVTEILGDNFVSGLMYKNKTTGEERKLDVQGIFVEIGQIPNTSFLKNVLELDELGRIKIDPWTGKTETPGIWAAGDCTNVLYHQNNIAAGDAVRALEDIYVTLHTK